MRLSTLSSLVTSSRPLLMRSACGRRRSQRRRAGAFRPVQLRHRVIGVHPREAVERLTSASASLSADCSSRPSPASRRREAGGADGDRGSSCSSTRPAAGVASQATLVTSPAKAGRSGGRSPKPRHRGRTAATSEEDPEGRERRDPGGGAAAWVAPCQPTVSGRDRERHARAPDRRHKEGRAASRRRCPRGWRARTTPPGMPPVRRR
jgi:hypothetical protein